MGHGLRFIVIGFDSSEVGRWRFASVQFLGDECRSLPQFETMKRGRFWRSPSCL